MSENDPDSLMKRISAMQKALANFRIIGGEGVTVHGSMEHGYAVSVDGGEEGGGAAGGGGGGPATGACCIGADCHILTSADCATMGGTYQGDGALCDPNPCLTGACCFDDFCDIETETDCTDAEGIFKGAGTTCEDVDICPTGPCCTEFMGSFFCAQKANEARCTATSGEFLGLGVSCDPNPCECPTPITYSVFDVQLRIYGNVDFRYCDVDCMTGIDDSQTVDFTLSLTDHGDGSASVLLDNGNDFPCGLEDTGAQAFLICCRTSCGPCAHSEVWEVEIFINMHLCNDGGTACGDVPSQTDRITLTMWDTFCSFNATHVPLQLGVFPFPSGVYTGTTSMTEQGTAGGPCDARPGGGGGVGILGDISIDWQVTIAP